MMATIQVDFDEYIALLKEHHATKIVELVASHQDCGKYCAYCQKDRCGGKIDFSGRGRGKCIKCETVWLLAREAN